MRGQEKRLAAMTSLHVGGAAGEIVTAHSRDDIVAALRSTTGRAPGELLVLGGGSNVVISDAGFPGTVLRIDGGELHAIATPEADAYDFVVDAGVDWDALVAETVRLGCTGLEMLSGIPGRVGAAPMQNINAYGQQVCAVITSVEAVDRTTLAVDEIPEQECGFAFRTSRFKEEWADRYVVTRIRCRLPKQSASSPAPSTYADIVRFFESGGSPTDVTDRRRAVLTVRGRKSMLLDPADPNARSVGSFFIAPLVPVALGDDLERRFDAIGLRVKYPEGRDASLPEGYRRIPAAHVLRASGFNRSDSWGPVALSDKHVLALVARDGATAEDIWMVSNFIRARRGGMHGRAARLRAPVHRRVSALRTGTLRSPLPLRARGRGRARLDGESSLKRSCQAGEGRYRKKR